MSKETGEPAFPNVPSDPQYEEWDRDMDLRDYFAAKAMQGLIPIYWDSVDEYSDASELVKSLSTAAYEHADAMLKARGE